MKKISEEKSYEKCLSFIGIYLIDMKKNSSFCLVESIEISFEIENSWLVSWRSSWIIYLFSITLTFDSVAGMEGRGRVVRSCHIHSWKLMALVMAQSTCSFYGCLFVNCNFVSIDPRSENIIKQISYLRLQMLLTLLDSPLTKVGYRLFFPQITACEIAGHS